MKTYEISEAKVYVGTYAKYNDGSIYGAWIDLDSDMDSFFEKCRELHKDESDPEFMFQDWENIPECFISECSISETFFDIYDDLLQLENEGILDAFFSYCDYICGGCIDSEIVSKFRDAYEGEFDSEVDFAYYFVDEGLFGEVDEKIYCYLDFNKIARDIFMDYTFVDGYVFNAVG